MKLNVTISTLDGIVLEDLLVDDEGEFSATAILHLSPTIEEKFAAFIKEKIEDNFDTELA
jgi:hypothetical protein